MNRARKVDDLYESVKSISEPDAFQYTIEREPDDYVIADLRKRFWDGKGDKPWQVVEINRLLTRRNETRTAVPVPPPSPVPALDPPKSLVQKIADNVVVFFLGAIIAAFCAGLGAYKGALELTDRTVVSNEELKKLTSRSHTEPITQLVRSDAGAHAAATVNFVNVSGRQAEIVWIDTGGKEKLMQTLTDGASYSLSTSSGHLILVKDPASGEAILLLSPRGEKVRAVNVELQKEQ
jgi:hypothetical protein